MKFLLLFVFILPGLTAYSQTRISGKVADARGEPIPGANVVINGTYDGTSTDVNGSFSFSTEERGEQVIEVSFVGFKKFSKAYILDGTAIQLDVYLKEQINELDAVVISAGSFTAGEEKRRTVLKPTDIATTAGATADIAGALNTLPGTQKVGESGRLFVRGGSSNESRTFIDGMLVLNDYQQAAPNAPSRGRFLPFMFKGTSFSTGGYSAEYGQALSSALVLDSKDKAEINQTDIGLLSVGGDVAHTQVWDKASLSGKVQYTNIRPYFNLINQEIDWVKPPASIEGSTAFRQEVGEGGMFKFFGNANHANFIINHHDVSDPTLISQYEQTNDYSYGNATYRQLLNEKWFVRGGLSFTQSKNEFIIDGNPMREDEQGIHGKAVVEHEVSDKVELRVGGEIIDRNYNATQNTQSLSFHEPISSMFVESELYATNSLVTRVGVRAEYNGLNDQIHADPRMSVAYRPFKRGQFSLAYGRFRQSVQNQYLRLNNQLNSEVAEHFILNYQMINDNRTFRSEIYYKKYDQLVKFAGNPTSLTNDGTGYARGFELFWRDSKSFKNVDYWISYSFLDTERDYLDFPYSATPHFASRHNLSLVYKHFITELKTQLGLTYSIASGRPYEDPNVEQFLSRRTPTYQDLSANIAYLPKPWLIIYVSATNLFGHDNIFGYEYSTSPDLNGAYSSRPIRQPAKRFLFLGVFITLSKNKSINQLPNL